MCDRKHSKSVYLWLELIECGEYTQPLKYSEVTESSRNSAATLSRVNFSVHVGQATIFGWIITTACCLAAGIGVRLGLQCPFG